MLKKIRIAIGLLLIAAAVGFYAKHHYRKNVIPAKAGIQVSTTNTPPNPLPGREGTKGEGKDVRGNDELESLQKEFLSQLNTPEKKQPQRTLDLPAPRPDLQNEPAPPPQILTPEEKARAAGRKKREGLPLGVILHDGVPIYKSATSGEVLYTMSTGDFVKVYDDQTEQRRRVHPGVDVYLAATSKEIETAGNRFPDAAGWVERAQMHVFGPERAKEFTQGIEPMTLGRDPNFSTVDFYERAFKNPDPVVHRAIGPRLIALLSLHEDYSTAWGRLYRDPDEKIRAVTLASLRERGVSKSPRLIEDLIARLIELKTHGRPETDPEISAITEILKESGSPRAQNALKSLSE